MWEPLRAVFSWLAKGLQIEKLSATSIMVTAPAKKPKFRLDAGTLREKINSFLPARTNHELKRYMGEDDTASPFARIIRYALTNALGRKALQSPLDLIAPPAATPAVEAETYRAEIAQAQQPRKKDYPCL